jgi:hypothetical protein
MKKMFLAITSVLASASLMMGVAAATSADCSIVNTGPDSNNKCSVVEENSLKITCNNNTDVVFVNNQSANSGSVTLESNTNGGYAYSGSAVNTNETTGKLNVSCAPKVASAPTPVPAPTPAPPAGGQGGGAGQAQPAAQPAPAVLPNTGSNTLATTAIVSTVVLGIGAAAARFGVSAYRFFAVK